MQHSMGQAGQTRKARRPIEVADDLGHAEGCEGGLSFPHQRIDAPSARQLGQGATNHIAATDNKQSLHRTIIAWPTESP